MLKGLLFDFYYFNHLETVASERRKRDNGFRDNVLWAHNVFGGFHFLSGWVPPFRDASLPRHHVWESGYLLATHSGTTLRGIPGKSEPPGLLHGKLVKPPEAPPPAAALLLAGAPIPQPNQTM